MFGADWGYVVLMKVAEYKIKPKANLIHADLTDTELGSSRMPDRSIHL